MLSLRLLERTQQQHSYAETKPRYSACMETAERICIEVTLALINKNDEGFLIC